MTSGKHKQKRTIEGVMESSERGETKSPAHCINLETDGEKED